MRLTVIQSKRNLTLKKNFRPGNIKTFLYVWSCCASHCVTRIFQSISMDYLTMVNQQVRQYCYRWMPFAEKFRFLRWASKRKLVTIFEKNASFELCLDYKRVSNPQDWFGVGLMGKLGAKFVISCLGIFPLAGAVEALWSKMYWQNRVFPGGRCFPWTLTSKAASKSGATLWPIQTEEVRYLAVQLLFMYNALFLLRLPAKSTVM